MRTPLYLILPLLLAACSDAPEPAPPEESRTQVETAIADLDAMRSSLAPTVGDSAVTPATFARVCKPVGRQAKQLAQTNGWVVRQLATKYRNPDHAPDQEARPLFDRFRDEPTLDSLWMRTTHSGTPGWRYLRRITVEPACLACHGPKDERPAFIVEKYPEDRAFGFEVGDLRGLYSVFVPDSLLALRSGPLAYGGR